MQGKWLLGSTTVLSPRKRESAFYVFSQYCWFQKVVAIS